MEDERDYDDYYPEEEEEPEDVEYRASKTPSSLCLGDFLSSPGKCSGESGNCNATNDCWAGDDSEDNEAQDSVSSAQAKLVKLVLSPKVEIIANPVFDFDKLPMGPFVLT